MAEGDAITIALVSLHFGRVHVNAGIGVIEGVVGLCGCASPGSRLAAINLEIGDVTELLFNPLRHRPAQNNPVLAALRGQRRPGHDVDGDRLLHRLETAIADGEDKMVCAFKCAGRGV